MTRVEKLIKSLETKKANLEKKRDTLKADYDEEMADIKEKMEVINLQLSGLKKQYGTINKFRLGQSRILYWARMVGCENHLCAHNDGDY